MPLGKWSRMVISGKPVTKKQANEIIIRTNDFWLSTNDKWFKRELIEVLDVPYQDRWPNFDINKMDERKNELKVLDLEYLCNYRIVCNSIVGPYGWCDWDGTIGGNYNIGKWPSEGNVEKELKSIAEAFPFLNFRCQLWNEDDKEPMIEFKVKNGMTKESKCTYMNSISNGGVMGILSTLQYGGERGCTIDQFKEALEITRNSIKMKN